MKRLIGMALAATVAIGVAMSVTSCSDKPGPPPGAPQATINQQDTNPQSAPSYGQIREAQKEGQ